MKKKPNISITPFNEVENLVHQLQDEFSAAAYLSLNDLIKNKINNLLNTSNKIKDICNKTLLNLGELINKKDNLNEQHKNIYDEKKKYLDEILIILDKEKVEENPEEILTNFLHPIDVISDHYPEKIITNQQQERFNSLPNDSFRIKAGKRFKKIYSLFRKKWEQEIRLKEIISYYSSGFLADNSIKILNRIERIRCLIHLANKEYINLVLNNYNLEIEKLRINENEKKLAELTVDGKTISQLFEKNTELIENEKKILYEEFKSLIEDVNAKIKDSSFKAGTIEYSARISSSKNLVKTRKKSLKKWGKKFNLWLTYEKSLINYSIVKSQVELLSTSIVSNLETTLIEFKNYIANDFILPVTENISLLKNIYNKVKQFISEGLVDINSLTEVHLNLREELQKNRRRIIEEKNSWENITKNLDVFIKKTSDYSKNVPESKEISVDEITEIPLHPEKINIREPQLRNYTELFTSIKISRDIKAVIILNEPEFKSIFISIENIIRAVDFNFSTAINSLEIQTKESKTTAEKLISGVIERSIKQFGDLLASSKEIENILFNSLNESVNSAVKEFSGQILNRNFTSIKKELFESKLRKKSGNTISRVKELQSVNYPKFKLALSSAWKGISEINKLSREKLGLVTYERVASLSILDESVLDKNYKEKLPLIYQKLFSFDPLSAEEFFIGRKTEMKTISLAYDRWKDGKVSSIAVHGEKGSGKTSLLNLARKNILINHPVKYLKSDTTINNFNELLPELTKLLNVNKVNSFNELAESVKSREKTIVIIEGVNNFFLKTIGGFDVIREFLLFMAKTSEEIFWIISVEQQAWNYLNKFLELEDQFIFIINATNMHEERIKEAILLRHQVSGYSIKFNIDDKLKRTKKFKKLSTERSKQEAAQIHFIELLSKIAEGNIFIAIFYWIRSIDFIDGHTLYFHMPVIIDISFVGRLSNIKLHTLAAIIQHDGLSVKSHSKIFLLSIEESELILSSLDKLNLLFFDESGEYKINKVLYRSFVRLLKAKNIL